VTTQTRYIATLLATGAIAVAIGYAPVAFDDPGSTAGGPNGSSITVVLLTISSVTLFIFHRTRVFAARAFARR
jgi:hypothetical protein